MVIHLPQKGARVGAYEIIERIGHGGGGYVYKARRGERYYAIKFLNTLDFDGWTRREVTALATLPLPNVVRFVGYDRWPDAEMGYPCIIMEFVSGLPLGLYVLRYNPSTRRALTIFLKMTRALREVFRLGVLHRDIKESNVILRARDDEPILIDFGFSSIAGAPTVTGPGKLPPGTPEYRSPEAMRFLAGLTEENTYTYGLSDELWALGVTLYWLLTDVLPFGTRKEPGLNARIRLESPPPPRLVNPRLSEAASRLCLRMLEKDPRARFQTHDEVCSAVEALLSAHEEDASWDVPLIDPESPHLVSTVGGPKSQRERDEKPRRGRWKEGEPEEAAAAQPPAKVPAGPVAGGAAPKRPFLVLGVGLALGALAVGTWNRPESALEATPALLAKAAPPPVASIPGGETAGVAPVREVARPGNPTQADKGAAPVRAQPPAPPSTAMHRKPDTTKTPDATSKHPPQRTGRLPTVKNAAAVGAACALLEGGCTGGTSQVRPEPAPLECPAGSRDTHAKFRLRGEGSVVLQGYRGVAGEELVTMKEGPVTVVVDLLGWSKLPPGTLLTGTLTVGEKRFFGRFTQAQTPDRQTYPVCIQVYTPTLRGMREGPDCLPGVGRCLMPGSKPGAFKVFPRLEVEATSRFE